MASRRCLNAACGEAEPGGEWKKGWRLRSGRFAELCQKCGLAYEKLMFCDVFHLKESGWRECNYCGKRLHCGCIASKFLIDLLDGGGIQCIICMKNSTPNEVVREFSKQNEHKVLSVRGVKDQIANDFCTTHCASELRLASSDGIMEGGTGDMCQAKAIQLGKQMEGNGHSCVLPLQSDNIDGSFKQITREQVSSLIEETGTEARSIKLLNRNPGPVSSSCIYRRDERKTSLTENIICKSMDQTCVGPADISLEVSKPGNLGIPQKIPPTIGADVEGKDKNQQMQRACYFFPMPPTAGDVSAPEASKNVLPHMRFSRPPGEGRGRHQLLPRYWPRITERELQQISGHSNSTIVPLFEKVLTASDTGRIGRLVLPKACAEAYFPPISQPEGLPLTIQDAKGKDWQFQFRFWPNNNSRMYVLEGFTPCIQSLQLQAGDTVTFSRIDPEGRLIMGYRKANNSETLQDSQSLPIPNAGLGNEASLLAANKDLHIISGYSICQSSKDNADPQSSCSLSEYLNSVNGFTGWHKTDVTGGMVNGGSPLPLLVPERRTSHNIGFKSKRLHMDNDDALELKLTWEEAQDLLCPPPSATPNIFMVENEEVEEYEEPPVFGKRVIFTARASGGHDQWVQCDNCFKWRRLPLNVTISSNWTCADNTWDPKRSSCSIPGELSSTELQDLLGQSADIKRQKIVASLEQNSSKPKGSGLDTLAAVAAHKEVGSQPAPSPEITTRHPRHRPGCTCIVCTQPPSGKGPKHSPACTCNVCMSVKRRFKTLRMRKQQRQSKPEEAEAQKKLSRGSKEQPEACSSLKSFQPLDPLQKSDPGHPEMKKGQIDLNFFPESDESDQIQPSVASHPLQAYLQQHGFESLNTGTASELEIRHDDSTRRN